MKQCRDCNQIKVLTLFTAHWGCRLGVRPECKECQAIAKSAAYASNKADILVNCRLWAKSNPEARKIIQKRYYDNHAERERARSSKYASENPAIKAAQCA